MDIADDNDGFGYHDVERMIEARRGLGRRCDRDFVQQLVDGSLPSVRAQEYGLLTLEEAAEEALADVLFSDVAAVQSYGGLYPGTWAGIRLDREGVVQVVVASFTGDIEGHRARLVPLVARPDRLRLRRRPFSERELARVQAEIGTDGSQRIKELGIGDGAVEVALGATAESLAAEWHRRYGDALRITVGNLPYPPTTEPWPVVEAPRSTTTLAGVELRVVLDAPDVATGENLEGRLVLSNRSDTPVPIQSGQPLVGVVVRPGTDEVVGCFSGAVAGTGWSAVLSPGDEASLRVVVGTASCRLDAGYLLPPGTYEAVVPLRLYGREGRPDVMVAPPVPITLR